MPTYAKDVLVDTEWVEQHLDDGSIRIVEVDENPALYAEAHIPGAIGFDWKKDLQDQVKRDFLGPRGLRRAVRPRGISNDHTIVLYGDRNNWFAAYTYWYLKYYGHDRSSWSTGRARSGSPRAGRPPATSRLRARDLHARRPATTRSARTATRSSPPSTTASAWSTSARRRSSSGELIAMAGYEQEGAQRAGHIPGAASVPWAQAVSEDGTFKTADELRELYTSKGVLNGEPIIAYCRIGERSAHTWFVLHELLGRRRQELRRLVDRVGQHGRRPDREGRLAAGPV